MNGINEDKDKNIEELKSDEKKVATGDVKQQKLSKIITETFEETYEITETTLKLKNGDNFEEIRKIINQSTIERSNSDRKGRILIDLETIAKKGDDEGDKNFILTEKSFEKLNKDGKYKQFSREIEIVREKNTSAYNNSDKIKDIRKIVNRENVGMEESVKGNRNNEDGEKEEKHGAGEKEETYAEKIDKIKKIINQEVTNKETEGKILIDIEEIIKGKNTIIEEKENNEIEEDKDREDDSVSDNLKLEFKGEETVQEKEQKKEHEDENKDESELELEYKHEHEHELKKVHDNEQERKHERVIYATTVDEIDNILKIINQESEEDPKEEGKLLFDMKEITEAEITRKESQEDKTTQKIRKGSKNDFIKKLARSTSKKLSKDSSNKSEEIKIDSENIKVEEKVSNDAKETEQMGKLKKEISQDESVLNQKRKPKKNVFVFLYNENKNGEEDLVSKKNNEESNEEKGEPSINEETENKTKTLHTNEITEEAHTNKNDVNQIYEVEMNPNPVGSEKKHLNDEGLENTSEECENTILSKEHNDETTEKEIEEIRRVINQEATNDDAKVGKILIDLNEVADRNSDEFLKESKHKDDSANKSLFSINTKNELAKITSRKSSTESSSSNKTEEIEVEDVNIKAEEKVRMSDDSDQPDKIDGLKKEISHELKDLNKKGSPLITVHEFLYKDKNDGGEMVSKGYNKESNTKCSEKEEEIFETNTSVNRETECEENILGNEQNEEINEKEIEEIRKVINQEATNDEGKTGKMLIDLDKEVTDINDSDELLKRGKNDENNSNKSKFSIKSIKKLVRKLSKDSKLGEFKVEQGDIKADEKEKVSDDANEPHQINELEEEISQEETKLKKEATPSMEVHEFLCDENKIDGEDLVSKKQNEKSYTEGKIDKMEKPFEENASIIDETKDNSKKLHTNECIEPEIKEEAHGNENAADQIGESTNEVELNTKPVGSEEEYKDGNCQYNLNEDFGSTSEECEKTIVRKEQNDETNEKEIEEIRKVINQESSDDEEKIGKFLIDLDEVSDISNSDELLKESKNDKTENEPLASLHSKNEIIRVGSTIIEEEEEEEEKDENEIEKEKNTFAKNISRKSSTGSSSSNKSEERNVEEINVENEDIKTEEKEKEQNERRETDKIFELQKESSQEEIELNNEEETPLMDVYEFLKSEKYCLEDLVSKQKNEECFTEGKKEEEEHFEKNYFRNEETEDKSKTIHTNECQETEIKEEALVNDDAIDQICEHTNEVELKTKTVGSEEKHVDVDHQYNLSNDESERTSENCEKNIPGMEQNEETNEKDIEEIRKVINQEDSDDEGKTGKILIDLDKEIIDINDADELSKGKKDDDSSSNKSKFSIQSIKKLVRSTSRKLSKESTSTNKSEEINDEELKIENEDIKGKEKEKVNIDANEIDQIDKLENEITQKETELNKDETPLMDVYEFLEIEKKNSEEEMISKQKNKECYTECNEEENSSNKKESDEVKIKEEASGNENAIDQICENTNEVELNAESVRSEEKNVIGNHQYNLNDEGSKKTSEESEKNILEKEQNDETDKKEIEEIKKIINQKDGGKVGKILIDLNQITDTNDDNEMCSKKKVCNGILSSTVINEKEDNLLNDEKENFEENSRTQNDESEEIKDLEDIKSENKTNDSTEEMNWLEHCILSASEVGRFEEEIKDENDQSEKPLNENESNIDHVIGKASENLTKNILKTEITDSEDECSEKNFTTIWDEKIVDSSINKEEKLVDSTEKKMDIQKDSFTRSMDNSTEKNIKDDKKHDYELQKINENETNSENDDGIEQIRKIVNQIENHENSGKGKILIDLGSITDQEKINNQGNEKITEIDGAKDLKSCTQGKNNEIDKLDKDKQKEIADNTIRQVREIINQAIDDNNLEEKKQDEINKLNDSVKPLHFTEHSRSQSKEMDEDMKQREEEFNKVWKPVNKEEIHNKVEEIRKIVSEETISEVDEDICLRNNATKGNKREKITERLKQSSFCKLDKSILQRNSVDGVVSEFLARKESFKGGVDRNSIDDGKNISSHNCCASENEFCNGGKLVQGELDINDTNDVSSFNCLQSRGGKALNSNYISNDTNNTIAGVKGDDITTSNNLVDSGSSTKETIMENKTKTSKFNTPKTETELSANSSGSSETNEIKLYQTKNVPELKSFNKNWLMTDDDDILKSLVTEREKIDFKLYRKNSDPSGMNKKKSLGNIGQRKSVSFEDFQSNDEFPKRKSEDLRIEILKKMKKMHEMKAFQIRKSLSYDGDDILGILDKQIEDEEPASKSKINPLDELDQLMKMNSKRKTSSLSVSLSYDERGSKASLSDESDNEDFERYPKNKFSKLDQTANTLKVNENKSFPIRHSLSYDGEDILNVLSNGDGDSSPENQSRVQTVDVEIHENTGISSIHKCKDIKESYQNHMNNPCSTFLDPITKENVFPNSDTLNNTINNDSSLSDQKTSLDSVKKHVDADATENIKNRNCDENSYNKLCDFNNILPENVNESKEPSKISLSLSDDEKHNLTFDHPIPPLRKRRYTSMPVLNDTEDEVDFAKTMEAVAPPRKRSLQRKMNGKLSGTVSCSLSNISSYKPDVNFLEEINSSTKLKHSVDDMFLPRHTSPVSFASPEVSNIVHERNYGVRASVQLLDSPMGTGSETLPFTTKKTPHLKKKSYTFTKGDTYMADVRNNIKKKKKHRSVSSLFRRTFSMNDVKKPDSPPCLPNLFKRLRHKKNKHQCDLNNLPPIKEDYTLQNSNTAESFASIFMSDEEEDAYLEKCIGDRQKTESFISLRFPENLQRSMSSVDVSKYASSSIKKSPLITKKKKSDVLMRIGSGHRSLRKRLRRPHLKNLKHDTSTVSLDAEALKNAKELLDRTLASKLESQKIETPTLPEPLQNRPSIISQQYSDIAEDTDNIEEKEDNKDQLETPVLKPRKDRGLRGSLKSMFLSEKKSDAVKRQLSFSIPGEQNQKSDAEQLTKEETLENLKKLAEEHRNSEKDRVKFLKEEAKSLENISHKIHAIHDSQEDYHERVMRKFIRRYSQDIMNISNSEGKLEELTNKYKVPFEDDMDKIKQIAGKEILGIENIDHHSMNKINLFDSEQRRESLGLSLTASSVNESDSSRVSPSTGTPSNELNLSYEDLDKLEKESSKTKPENTYENSKYQVFKFPYVNREKSDDDFPINKETLIKECLDGTLNLKLQNIVKDSEEIIDPDVLETDSTHLLALAYEKEIYRHMREHLNSSGSMHDLDVIQKLASIYEEELLSYFDIKGKNVMKLAASEITQRRGSIINLEMLMDTKLNKENLIKECLDGTLNIKLKNAIRENDKIWDPNRLEVDTTKLLALEYEKEILQHMKENFDLYDENEELKTIRKLVRIYEDELLTRFDVKGENFLKLADKEITQRRGSVINLKRIREFIEEYGSRFQSESDDSDSELLQIPQAKTKARKSVSIEDSATVITNTNNHHPYFTLISDLEKETEGSGVSTPSSVSEKTPDHFKNSNFNVSGQEFHTLIDKAIMNESTEDLDSNNDKDNNLNDDINKDIIALGNEYEDEILAHAFRLSLQRFSSAPKLKRVSSQSESKTKNIPKFSFQSMKNKSQDLFKNVRRYSSPILTKAFSFELPSKRPISPTTNWNKYSIDHPIIEGIVSKEVENYPQLPEWVRFQPLSLAKLSSNVYFGNKKHDIFSKMMNTSESINKFIRSASISNSLSFDEKPTPTIKQPADNTEVNPYRGLGPSIQHLYVARSNSLITYESSPPHSPVSLSGGNKCSENQANEFQAFGFSRSPIPEGKIARHFPYEDKETTFDRKSPRSSPDSFDSLLNDNEIKTFLDTPKNNFSSFEENTDRGGNRIVHSPLTKRKFFVSPVPSDASYTSFTFDDNPENKEKDESSSAHYFKPIEGESTDCQPSKISVKRAYLNTKPIQRSFAIDISSESLSDSHSITSQDSDTTPKTDFSKTDLVDDCYNPNLANIQAKDDGISEDYQSQPLKDETLLDQESQEFEITTELSENNQVQEKSSNESHEDSDTNSQTCKDIRKSFQNQRVPTIEVSDISSENEISFEKSDPEDFNGRNVQSDDNLSEKVSDSHKNFSNEIRSNESFESLSSSDDNEIPLRPINEDTNIIKEKCSLNCECELHVEDSDPVKILAVHEKPESPDYVLRTWYERQEIPDGFSSPSPVIIPKWVKSDESSDDSDIRSRKDTPSPAPPTDKVARSSSHSPDEVDSKKEEERIQKDRCIEVYPETVRQRQRTMAPSPSKVDIKNWEPTEDSKKFLPSVKALRNQFENGKSKNDNTLVRTPSDSSSANSLILNSLDTSSGFGSLTSSQANTEQTSEGPKLTPRDPNEPVEPIFSQFREVDEEFKEMMSKPPSTQGWNPQPLLKKLYYVPDAPKMHRREVPFINIEGYLEKLPSGRKKATFWNAWKRRYFVAKDGILFYYQNNQSEKPNMKLPLIGGKIEIMDPSMISVEDGGRESRSAGMLGIDDGKGHYVVVRCPSRQEAERWKEALESHTYDDFTSQYIQPWPRPTNPTLLRDTLVIDIGSCSVRAGVLASQPTLPQVFFPSVVATNRETKAQIWGIEALMPDVRPTSSISFPIRPSHKISKFSVDLNAVSSLLQKTFNDLKVDPKNYNIQLSVPRVLNPHTQAELLKILFDKYGVKSVNMTHQSILALYAYNATSGIIVDIGERLDVVPVIDGYIVDGGVSRVPYGGYRITDHLRQFLFQKNISLINEIDSYIIRMILESICYCAQHYNTEKQRCTMNPENFEKLAPLAEFFSDDPRFDTFRNLSLDFGRFQATEGLFNPDAWGLDHPGLHKLVHKAIQECSMDIRKELSRSIFLVGGVSQLPGIVDRLTVEIDNLTPPAIRPKVHASPYRYHASFLGACILAESDAFGQSKITKEEWTKQGNSALRKWAL